MDKMVLYDWRYRYQSIDEVMAELDNIGKHNFKKQSQQKTVFIQNNQAQTPDRFWAKIGLSIVFTAIFADVIIHNIPQQQETSPQSSINENQLHADYSKLEIMLAEGMWKEADIETENIMLQIADRKSEAWLNAVSISTFPCSDLRKIDQLWVENSNRNFGFSIQKPIYLKTGNQPRKFQEETYKLFGKTVGWYQNERWLEYDELTFNFPGNSPKGHLPAPHRKRTSSAFAPYHYLMDKLIKCDL